MNEVKLRGKELAQRVELLLWRHRIKGYEMCERSGVAPSTLSNIRQGRGADLAPLLKLASTFGVSVGWLLGEIELSDADLNQ